MSRTTAGRGDDGAAPVDFVLLVGVLTLLFLMVLQLGVALYVRNVLASAAAEGARYGANADFPTHTSEAIDRTREIVQDQLGAGFKVDVTSHVVAVDGMDDVEVEVTASLPLVALWGSARTVHLRGDAVAEG